MQGMNKLKKIIRKITSAVTIFCIGLCVGAGVMHFYKEKDSQNNAADQVTTVNYGKDKINHYAFNFKGRSISFTSESDGAGKAETTIPKTLVPEASAWLTKVHGINASVGYRWPYEHGGSSVSLGYSHRFGAFTFNGGLDFTSKTIGLSCGAGYWF
jgi:hypothetical protein